MGLGPIQAIYQARFMKYLESRGYIPAGKQKVWCFLGDGECDEPESLGAISLAGRENLDNLIFVINCNLQRLDGPVRGNGKIIQELDDQGRGDQHDQSVCQGMCRLRYPLQRTAAGPDRHQICFGTGQQ